MSKLYQIARRSVMMRHLSYSARKVYTEPLIDGNYKVSPAREVPEHIVRPPYVGKPNQQFEDLNEKPIIQHDKDALEKLRISARLAADTLSEGMKAAKLGNTTEDIDKAVHDFIIADDAYPTPIDYLHFPKSVCTSVNEVLCHGIPDNRVLKNGDYVNIDVTCYRDILFCLSDILIQLD